MPAFSQRVIVAAATILLAVVAAAAVEPYPTRTVRLLCWTSAGSPLDVMMRQLGKQLGEHYGQNFVVDNRPGGSGVVAMAAVINQPADGYNILSTTSSMSFTMANGRIPYEPANFTVLPAIEAEPSAVAVRADSRFKTLKQVMDHLRDKPNELSVGGFSSAGFHQFVFYRLQQVGHFKSVWVPYKGGQEAGLALLGGHIDVAVMTPSSATAQIRNGDIRLLGISSEQRTEYFPDVPTFKEQGYDVVNQNWRGIFAPPGIPQAEVKYWRNALKKMTESEAWKKELENHQWIASYEDETFTDSLARETKMYTDLLTSLNLVKKN
jgi:tripartite-type tricarboxylate transporter receptor subunit TctC